MPNYDDTTVAQTIPISSPRPRRIDRSRERYPRDGSLEETFVERRHYTRDSQSPIGHLSVHRDEIIRQPHRSSRSADPPPRRQVGFHDRGGYESSDDSDSEYKHSRAVSRRKSDRHLKIVPCGDKCDDHPQKMASRNKAKSRDSDLDSDYSSSEEFEKRAKHRNRKLLYTGLACVTTVAAANNIYQNTKAHHARRKQVREGEMCTSEVKRLKNKALLMDLFTVGVIGVGINNCRMGWKRVEAIKQEGR